MNPPLPIAKDNAPHYSWGDACDGWHLVRTPEFSVIQERMPPGTKEVRHRHARSRQFFYVLAGTLTIEVDAVTHSLPPHHGIEIPPGSVHEVRNDSAAHVDFLVISQPPSHGDRLRPPSE